VCIDVREWVKVFEYNSIEVYSAGVLLLHLRQACLFENIPFAFDLFSV